MQENLFSTLVLGSVFNDYVVFYGDFVIAAFNALLLKTNECRISMAYLFLQVAKYRRGKKTRLLEFFEREVQNEFGGRADGYALSTTLQRLLSGDVHSD